MEVLAQGQLFVSVRSDLIAGKNLGDTQMFVSKVIFQIGLALCNQGRYMEAFAPELDIPELRFF